MSPRELPGFVFDEERGRYFPISLTTQNPNATRYDREDIKRRKLDKEKQRNLSQLEARRSEIYRHYFPKLLDPQEKVFGRSNAFDFVEGVERERYGFDKINHCDQFTGSIPINIWHCSICKDSSTLIVADESRIFRFAIEGHDISQLLRSYNLSDLEASIPAFEVQQSQALLKRIDFDPVENSAFVHLHILGTNIHYFLLEDLTGRDAGGRRCRFEFKSYENIHDSVNIGPNFVIAFNNKIAVISWDTGVPRMVRVLDKNKKSEILSLAYTGCCSGSKFLYAGCRDGSIYAIPFNEGHVRQAPDRKFSSDFDFKLIKKAKFPGVKLIVNIKPLDDFGLIAVSGIFHTGSTGVKQALFIGDVLRNPCEMVIRFESTFRNLVRDKEIFEISPDGHYICYGTCDGKGDFELFSTHLNDNLVIESSNSVIYYPLPYKSDEICRDIEYSRLTTAWLNYYKYNWEDPREVKHLRLFLALELGGRENSPSSTIVSASL